MDLARLAGLSPAGVLCEVTNEDGAMARLPELKALGKKLGLKLITIRDLILYRLRNDRLVEHAVATTLPTRYGAFALHAFDDALSGDVHVALTMGDVTSAEPVLTRVHSQCLTGDVFHSTRCDCGEQLEFAMAAIAKEGRGALVYLPQEGRGIGLRNKLRSYQLQDGGLDTVEANVRLGFRPDERTYVAGGQVLRTLGVRRVRLLTNNPNKTAEIERVGIHVVERIPVHVAPSEWNRRYLETKRDKLGHLLPRDEDPVAAAEGPRTEKGASRT